MSDNSEEKGFKTLKLTTLKVAKAGEAKPASSSGSESASRPVPAPAPAAPVTREVQAAAESETPSAASTPAPSLSPSAASSGPSLKPFKVLSVPKSAQPGESAAVTQPVAQPSPDSGESKSFKPLEVKATNGAVAPAAEVAPSPVATIAGSMPPLPQVTPAPFPGAEPARAAQDMAPGGQKLRMSAPAAPAEASASGEKPKAAVAKPSLRPLLLIGGVAVALIAGVVAYFLFGESASDAPAPVKPVAAAPSKPNAPVAKKPATPVAAPVKVASPAKPAEPVAVATPSPVSVTEAVAALSRKPETEAWLRAATVTAIAAQRVTLNDRVYSLNDIVHADGALRWVGRDSRTNDLLFVDAAGVVYSKPTRSAR